MADNFKDERAYEQFWIDLGLDSFAAKTAAQCYAEHWRNDAFYSLSHRKKELGFEELIQRTAEWKANKHATEAPPIDRANARHPAFWIAQGYEIDEATMRAVAANAMVKLQRDAAPPPPPQPKPDRFLEVANALLMQATMQQRMEGPNDSYDIIDVQPTPADQPRPEPFDPADYPRFRVD